MVFNDREIIEEDVPDDKPLSAKSNPDHVDDTLKRLQELVQSIVPGVSVRREGIRIVLEFDIEFTSPAFLAGANRKKEDCTLTANTFKGGLRWWWRTMHSAHVDHKTLAKMEAEIFGRTETGNRVSITIDRPTSSSAELFNFRDPTSEKKTVNRQPRTVYYKWRICEGGPKQFGIVQQTEGHHAIQGLFYLSYGMDERGTKRWFLPQCATFSVRLVIAPDSLEKPDRIVPEAELAAGTTVGTKLTQIAYSLRLLESFGGLGSRSRKGFGSFVIRQRQEVASTEVELLQLSDIIRKAIDDANSFRCYTNINEFAHQRIVAPCLDHIHGPLLFVAVTLVELPPPPKGLAAMKALDKLGTAMKSFAKTRHHERYKARLGLPRKDIRKPLGQELLAEDHVLFEGIPVWKNDLENRLSQLQTDPSADAKLMCSLRNALEKSTEKRSVLGEPKRNVEFCTNRLERFASPVLFRGIQTAEDYAFASIMFLTDAIEYKDGPGQDRKPSSILFNELSAHLSANLP